MECFVTPADFRFISKLNIKIFREKMENIVNPILEIKDLCVSYTKSVMAVKHVNASIKRNEITAIMGPSGCGKSTLLRAINRMHELYKGIMVTGELMLGQQDILAMDPIQVRRNIGMVFQRPNPFPTMSISENVMAGYSLNGIHVSKSRKNEIIEKNLRSVGLWDEVKDALNKLGTFLSGGQQQRLCIARALALKPELLLMDEPTSALDPIATNRIEELMEDLKKEVTIMIVTHNMSQAKRISAYSMFMYLGELVEYDDTKKMFERANDQRTREYLVGKFG
jgi:phosphate transport system ATP-binding protein